MIVSVVGCRVTSLSIEGESESQRYTVTELEVELDKLRQANRIDIKECGATLGEVGSDDCRPHLDGCCRTITNKSWVACAHSIAEAV